MKTTTKRIQMQERDLDILQTVFEMRYITAQHIATLYPSTHAHKVPRGEFRQGLEAIEKRMRKLGQYGYLKRLDSSIPTSAERPIYLLGPQSLQPLAGERSYDPADIKAELQATRKYLGAQRLNKQLHVDHRLGINTFHVALTVALKKQEHTDWLYHQNGSPYWIEPTTKDLKDKLAPTVMLKNSEIPEITKSQIRVSSGAHTKISRNPDAMFILNLADHRVGYLYEKDRGTESHSVVAAKLLCYLEWYKQGLHRKVFGAKHLRILIETESTTRVENMIEQLFKINERGSGIFWFTTTHNINLESPENVLKSIWTIGHPRYLMEKHSLIEFKPPQPENKPLAATKLVEQW